MASAVVAAVSNAFSRVVGSPKSSRASSTTAAATSSTSTRTTAPPWPSHWNGQPVGAQHEVKFPFPCIGLDCAGERHGKGTMCQPYCDRTGKFANPALSGDAYWEAKGIAKTREGRQMGHYFDFDAWQEERNRKGGGQAKKRNRR